MRGKASGRAREDAGDVSCHMGTTRLAESVV